MALWSVFLLTMLAVTLGSSVRQKLVLLGRLNERARAQHGAEAGIRLAQAFLQTRTDNSYHSFNDSLGNSSLFRSFTIGEDTGTVSYALASPIAPQGRLELYGMTDEAAKLNINTAPGDSMQRLFEAIGFDRSFSQDLANSIVDWRDNDSYLSAPLGSAENSYYRGLDRPYEARNAPFEVLRELVLVKGVDEKVFAAVKDFVTVYGNGQVNANTAPKPVLIASGLSEAKAQRLIDYRNGADLLPGTADDMVFRDTALIVPALSQAYDMSPADISEYTSAVNSMAVTSRFYTVHSRVLNARKQVIGDSRAVLDRDGTIRSYEEL